MNINRDYLIINDVKKSNIKLDNGSMFFYITDKNTQNIFVNLVINVSNNDLIQKYANIENAEDYTLTMNIVKPDNTYKVVEGKLHDKEKAIFEFNLNEDCCDEIGTYRCELLTKCNINNHEEITTSNKLTYKVKSSVLNDLDDIVEAPEYPLVIQLFDKLSDIEQYEEDRRANELARQLTEEQRQARFNALDADMTNSIQAMNDKVVDVENRVSTKEQAVDKLIVDTKADINEYKAAKDTEIDEYKIAKDQQINEAIANQNNKIDTAIAEQNNRIEIVEASDNTQNTRLDALEAKDIAHETSITNIGAKNVEQDNRLDVVENRLNNIGEDITNTIQPTIDAQNNRLDSIEAVNISQGTRLDAIEIKNQQQDDRLLNTEKVNKRQDMDLKCLFAESKNNMIDVTEEGNSIYLQNSTVGYTLIDEIQGNTMVNCNKEADKELILNGNINTQGYSNVTLTEGVDGGLIDVALEGNTMVNVCDQKDPVAITKSYTVETGNHVALQGEYDGKCRPVVTGNTLVNLFSSIGCTGSGTLQLTHTGTSYTLTNTKLGSSVFQIYTAYDLYAKNVTLIFNYEHSSPRSKVIGYNDGEKFIKFTSNSKYIQVNQGLNVINVTIEGSDLGKCAYLWVGDLSSEDSTFTHTISDLIILEGDYTNKEIPGYFEGLQSSFEDKVVTQEMVDAGEELAENLGKYKVDYVISREDGTVGFTKTFYLNSPLLEGDTIEQQGDNVVHVHRYKKVVLDGSDDENWTLLEASDDYCRFVKRTIKPNAKLNQILICDTFKSRYYNSSIQDSSVTIGGSNDFYIYIETSKLSSPDLVGFKQWLQQNPTTVVYELATPQYEVISQNNTILCDSYVNGHLDVDSVVPIEKVDFLRFEEELTYLYVNTQYTVQFVSNAVSKVDITLGGAKLLNQDVAVGINKYMITTPSELIDNKLVLNGEGFNASNIVVTEATDQDFGYFEGMKSVGECEDNKIEILSQNKNLLPLSHVSTDSEGYGNRESADWSNVRLRPNTKYTLSYTGKATNCSNNAMWGIWITEQKTGKLIPGEHIISSAMTDISLSFTTTNEEYYRIQLKPSNADSTGLYLFKPDTVILEEGEKTSYIPYALNKKEILLNEPLRAVGDAKDKYVLIDGKWYIERNINKLKLNNEKITQVGYGNDIIGYSKWASADLECLIKNPLISQYSNKNNFMCDTYVSAGYWDIKDNIFIESNKICCIIPSMYNAENVYEYINSLNIIYQLASPTYEPIDYNPLSVYSDITHISNNSTIPCNMTIKNTGYNCLLKPSTTYTVSSNLGLNTVTTPSTLTEDCLRFYDTDTSDVTTMKDVTILEGDYTTGKPLPSHFSGIESAFEQEYDEEKGKYKVRVKVVGKNLFDVNKISRPITNKYHYSGINTWREYKLKPYTTYNISTIVTNNNKPMSYSYLCNTSYKDINFIVRGNNPIGTKGSKCITTGSDGLLIIGDYSGIITDYADMIITENSSSEYVEYEPYKESVIEFYIDEPLRGVRDVKDKVYVKNDKVVVERNCGQREYQDGDFGTYLTDKVNTVYQLAEPTYEEVEYNDVKLFIESFKNSTLFYDSNIPVTSKVHYSYSVPIVDTVAQTADISDQQDSMIIDLATQVSVMEMMLM